MSLCCLFPNVEQNGLKTTDIQKTIPIFDIGGHFLEVEHALSILKVRKSVISLIRNWPDVETEFKLGIFGGIDTMINLLLLAGAEALSAGTSKSKLLVKKKNRLMDDFGKVFQILKREEGKFLDHLGDDIDEMEDEDADSAEQMHLNKQLRLRKAVFDKKSWRKKAPARSDLLDIEHGATSLTQALVEECILHFVQVWFLDIFLSIKSHEEFPLFFRE